MKIMMLEDGVSYVTLHSETCAPPDPEMANLWPMGEHANLRSVVFDMYEGSPKLPERWRTLLTPELTRVCGCLKDFPVE
jgi:hypothetical protein